MGEVCSTVCPKMASLSPPRVEELETQCSEEQIVNPSDKKAAVILSTYSQIRRIGRGSFGVVYLLEKGGKMFAKKKIPKSVLKGEMNSMECILAEKQIMLNSDNPFVLKLFECFQDSKYVYFIMDLCIGGQLLDYITRNKSLSLHQTRFYAMEIILGLEYLHNKGIIHRDIKPENVLLDKDGHAKLTDFGLSKVGGAAKTFSNVGTPLYTAPEIINCKNGYDRMVDFWALGCLIYEMLHGKQPFEERNIEVLNRRIKEGNYNPIDPSLDYDARDLIQKLLIVNPEKRLGAKGIHEIKAHPFFSGLEWSDIAKKRVMPPLKVVSISMDKVKEPKSRQTVKIDQPVTSIEELRIPNFSVHEDHFKMERLALKA